MKQDKFLLTIVITIVVLMGLAVGVFLVRQNSQDYVADDSPEGIVHNYIFAIQEEDYKRAYGYLAKGEEKPSYLDFQKFYKNNQLDNYGIQITGSDFYEDDINEPVAVVYLLMIRSNNDPFNTGSRYTGQVELVNQEGNWKANSFPSRLWSWDWYRVD